MIFNYIDFDGLSSIEREVASIEDANIIRVLSPDGVWLADVSVDVSKFDLEVIAAEL